MKFSPTTSDATSLLPIVAILLIIHLVMVSSSHAERESEATSPPNACVSATVEVGQLEPIGITEFWEAAAGGDHCYHQPRPHLIVVHSMEGYYEHVNRRRLVPFQLCLSCKCCISVEDPTTCSTMPCCFGIDCQLPNKPFGVCAFVPRPAAVHPAPSKSYRPSLLNKTVGFLPLPFPFAFCQ